MKSVEGIKKHFENHPIYSWVIILFLATSFLTSWASGCLDLKEKFSPKEDKKESIVEKEFDYSKLKSTIEAAPKDIMRDVFYGVEKEVLLLKIGYPTEKENIDSLQILNLRWRTNNIDIKAIFYKNKLILAALKIDENEKKTFDLYLYNKKHNYSKPFGRLLFKDIMKNDYFYYETGQLSRTGKKLSAKVQFLPTGDYQHYDYYFSTNYCSNKENDLLNNKITLITIEPNYENNFEEIPKKVFEEIGHDFHYGKNFYYKENFINYLKNLNNLEE